MHPVLLKIGNFSVFTYGFFVAMGVLSAIFYIKREAVRVGENPDKIIDIGFYMIISGIIGARLLYIAIDPTAYIEDPFEILRLWNGGLVFYGGFFCALFTGVFFIKKNDMPFWKTADIFAPSFALAHFLGRIGCFFAGCCYGRVCDLPWAITFNHPDSLASPLGVPLHPTQLYSSLNNLFIFGILILLSRRKKFHGQVFWVYNLIYGITRSIVEIYRGDFRGEEVLGVFSMSQAIGLSMALVSVVMLVILGRNSGLKPEKDA